MTQEEIKQKQDEINNKYRNKLTYKSSKFYIKKMHELDDVVKCGKENLRRDDSYHGHEAPMHMMYKLGTLKCKEETQSCGYEFLIEYDKDEPTVGIYYGCKCLFPEGVDPSPYISRFNEEWESVRNEVLTLLNNTFPSKDFSYRFKMTNNANDGTYWPFWITLYVDEDIIEIALRATKIIRSVYEHMLGEQVYTPYKEPKPKKTTSLALTAFTEKAYDDLVASIVKKLGKNEKNITKYDREVRKILKVFIKNAESERIIEKAQLYEKAWAVTWPAVDFTFLLKELLDFMCKDKSFKISVPWQNVCRVFMDMEQKPWGNDTLKMSFEKIVKYGGKKNRDEKKKKAENLITKWLSENY